MGTLAEYLIDGIIYTSSKQNALYNSLNGVSGQQQPAIKCYCMAAIRFFSTRPLLT